MTIVGYNRGTPRQIARQAAAILNVDAASNTATGLVRGEKPVVIDLSYHVGAIQLTPSRGEQWYIVQAPWPTPKPGVTWILDSKIPFNTPEITLPATEGQQQIGTGAGPIQLHGSQINANGPLRLANADSSLLDTIRRARRGDTGGGALPDAATVDNGSLAYGIGTPLKQPNTTTPVYTQNGQWIPLLGSGNVNLSDLTQVFQNTLNTTINLAGSAFQLPAGGIPESMLTTDIQNLLGLAGTALQYSDITGTPAAGDPVVSNGSGGLEWGTPGSGGVSTSDWNSLLTLLFGTPVIGTILEVAVIPLLEIANISGLQDALNNLLDLSTWTTFLSDSNAALGQAGSDIGHFVLGLQNIPQGNVQGLVAALASFLSLSTWNSFLADANAALGSLGVDLPSLITALGNIPISSVAGLTGSLAGLLPLSTWTTFLTDANAALGTGGSDLGHLILGLGAIPIANITDLSTYTQYFNTLGQFDASQLFNVANIPMLAISRITGLTGYLSNLSSSGVLALAGLASGSLPAGITLPGGQLTGLATGIGSWLTGGGALPSATTLGASGLTGLAAGIATWLTSGGALPAATTATIGQVTSLPGYLTNLSSSGVLALAGLALGALPVGITLGAAGLTGLATGVGTWLTSGGALPAATTLGAGGLTGLATGVGTWLTGGGVLPSATILSGFGNVIDASSNPLSGYLTNMTSSGTFTPLQQLIDGTVGGTNNPVSSLIALINNISVRFFSEIPTGVINGVNTLFNLTQTATSGTLQVFVNGLLQRYGTDYTTSGAAVTLANAPGVGDTVHAMYQVGTTGGGMPYATVDSLMQSITGSTTTGGGGLSGMATWFTDLTGLMGSPTGLGTGVPVLPGVNSIPLLGPVQSQITSFIDNALGAGGSSFPWNFPLGFGNQTNTMGQVGTQISNGEHLAQQVLDTVVQQYTGTTNTGNSVQQLVSALNQQPGGSLGSVIPAEVLPDITAEMSSGIQAAHEVATSATTDLAAVLEYAQQESAQALGSFVQNTNVQTAIANAVSQGSVDALVTALNGIPVIGAPLAQLASSFTGHLTGLVNNWQGTTLPSAATPQVNAAAAAAANQQLQLAALTASIQSQLPHFYGGGNAGLSFQQTFTGTLPSGWVTPLAPGAGLVYNCALNTAQQASTDTQTVSGIWNVADNYPKMLILRSNATMTSYHYAIIQSNTSTNNCRIGVVVGGVNTPLGSAFGLPGSGALVANYAYNFEAVGRTLVLTGPNGLNQQVTDGSNVGQIGANYRYGGFGTGGTSLGTSGWGGATSGTFTPPAGMVTGDQYEVVAIAAGGGGGGGVGTWGNGGAGGQISTGLVTIGSSIGPAVGQAFTYYAGGGGGVGQSIYYVVQHEEFYFYGGNTGVITDTASNAAYPGAAGDVAYIQWPSPSGTQQIYSYGGGGGAANGGSPTGGAAGSAYINGDLFSGGPAASGWGATNGAAPDYNGGAGNNWGGGGTGCYSGTAQTDGADYYDGPHNHWIYWYYGINGWQYAGGGAPGAAWITPISRQLPGSMTSWAFYDAAVAGPISAQVPAGENTSSTSWADLATTTDTVTVNVGPSGMVVVTLGALIYPQTAGQWGMMGVALSGANTLAAQDTPNNYAIGHNVPTVGSWILAGNTFLIPNLNQGATIFKAKYQVSGGSCTFYNRALTVLPL
jgi:hypothetical protein